MTEGDQDSKRCPRCGEAIRREAVVCRFCGYDYIDPGAIGRGSGGTNGYSIASLVLGILWIFGLGALLALIFGLVARSQIKKSGGREGGNGMAVAGIVLGIVGLVGATWWIIAISVAASSSPY